MAFICPNLVHETTTVEGTDPATLLGAASGAQDFDSQLANGDTCPYTIVNADASKIEVGIGTFSTSGPTLTRTTVRHSTNGDAAENFGAGTKNVYSGLPGELIGSLIDPDASTGMVARTAEDTYARRTLTEGANIRLTNPAGIAGDPVIAVDGYYNPKDSTYGAIGSGSVNDAPALNAVFTAAAATGGIVIIPPGTYRCDSQVTITMAGPNIKLAIFAYGVEITTTGAIAGLKIVTTASNVGVAINGLEVNHRGNSTATFGFDLEDASNCTLFDCYVEAHDTGSGYAAFHIDTADPAVVDTNSLWNTLDRCMVRIRSGGDGTYPDYGLLIEGNCNATRVINCEFVACTTCICITYKGAVVTLANAVLIMGNTFETFGVAIHIKGLATSTLVGTRIIGNRAENGFGGTDAFLYITGTTAGAVVPPYLSGNMLISDVNNYIVNPNNVDVNSLDISITPDITGTYPNGGMSWRHNTRIISEDGSTHALGVLSEGGNRGMYIANNADDPAVYLLYQSGSGATTRGTIQGGGSSLLNLNSIRGISFSSNTAENLRGTATLNVGAIAVAFDNTEMDSNYYIAMSGNAAESFAVTGKTASGFTVTSDNLTSTATIDWILVR